MQREDGAPRTGGDGTPGPRRRAGDEAAGTDSIRERQRRRRDAGRIQADIETILARPQEEDEEDEGVAPPPGPPPARVYVVFRGAKWQDPDGVLRESDH